jgi:hypothetical protein
MVGVNAGGGGVSAPRKPVHLTGRVDDNDDSDARPSSCGASSPPWSRAEVPMVMARTAHSSIVVQYVTSAHQLLIWTLDCCFPTHWLLFYYLAFILIRIYCSHCRVAPLLVPELRTRIPPYCLRPACRCAAVTATRVTSSPLPGSIEVV